MRYDSAFDNTWILLPPSTNSGDSVTLSIQCKAKQECISNHYLENGICQHCPENAVASFGSTSIDDCKQCPAGTKLFHPMSSECTLSHDVVQIDESKGWRIWAPSSHSVSGWAWAVKNLSFYEDIYCQNLVSTSGIPIDSANAGSVDYGPENAFGLGMYENWGGRVDGNQAFWLGMTFDDLTRVQCVEITSFRHHVNEIRIQALDANGNWQNVWIQKLDVQKYISTNTIQLNYSGNPVTRSPVTTLSPTKAPTKAPTTNEVGVQCQEKGSNKYLLKVKANGQPIGRTCSSLSKKGSTQISKICSNSIQSQMKFPPASIACPVTCGCSDDSGDTDDNSGEGATCTQNNTDIFLFKIVYRNGVAKPLKRPCKWLESKPAAKKTQVCKSTKSLNGFLPANKICFKSCNSC